MGRAPHGTAKIKDRQRIAAKIGERSYYLGGFRALRDRRVECGGSRWRRLGRKQLLPLGPGGAEKREILVKAPDRGRKIKGHEAHRGKIMRVGPISGVHVATKKAPVEESMLRRHGRGDVIGLKVLRGNDPGAENDVGQPDIRPSELWVRGDTTHVHEGLAASEKRPQNMWEYFKRRDLGSRCLADFKTQTTDQSAIDMQPHEIAVVGMIAGFNVPSKGILRNQGGTQIRLIAELENGIPLGVAPGDTADHTLRKMR